MSINTVGSARFYSYQNCQQSQSQNPIVQQLEEKITQLMKKLRTEQSRSEIQITQCDLYLMTFFRNELIEKEEFLKIIKEYKKTISDLSRALLQEGDCKKVITAAFLVGMIGPATANFFGLSPFKKEMFTFLADQVDAKQIANMLSTNKPVEISSEKRNITDRNPRSAMLTLAQLEAKIDQIEQSLEQFSSYWIKSNDTEREILKKDLDLMLSVRDELVDKESLVQKMRKLEEKISSISDDILKARAKCEKGANIAEIGGAFVGKCVSPFDFTDSIAKSNRPGPF